MFDVEKGIPEDAMNFKAPDSNRDSKQNKTEHEQQIDQAYEQGDYERAVDLLFDKDDGINEQIFLHTMIRRFGSFSHVDYLALSEAEPDKFQDISSAAKVVQERIDSNKTIDSPDEINEDEFKTRDEIDEAEAEAEKEYSDFLMAVGKLLNDSNIGNLVAEKTHLPDVITDTEHVIQEAIIQLEEEIDGKIFTKNKYPNLTLSTDRSVEEKKRMLAAYKKWGKLDTGKRDMEARNKWRKTFVAAEEEAFKIRGTSF
jgi:hypothetical protein